VRFTTHLLTGFGRGRKQRIQGWKQLIRKKPVSIEEPGGLFGETVVTLLQLHLRTEATVSTGKINYPVALK
jgi:hypothetical protein